MAKIQDYLPKVETSAIQKQEPYYVTPYLSDRALMATKNHKMMAKQPVFIKAMLHDPSSYGYCKNCGGGGMIYLSMIEAGPFRDVPMTKNSITWFDGDGLNGKGW